MFFLHILILYHLLEEVIFTLYYLYTTTRAVEVLKLQVPKLHNSLEETQQWLTEGGVISAVKSFYFLEEHDALGGLEKVGTMLDKARYSNSLSSKLTAHLQRIDRTDLIPYIQYDTKHGKGGI